MSNVYDKNKNTFQWIAFFILCIPIFWYFQEPSLNKKTQWKSFLSPKDMCILTGESRGVSLILDIGYQIQNTHLFIKSPSQFNNLIHRDINYRKNDPYSDAEIKFGLYDVSASDPYSYYDVPMFFERNGLQDIIESENYKSSLIKKILRSEIITIRNKSQTASGISDDTIGIWEITSIEHKKIISDFTECVNNMGWS